MDTGNRSDQRLRALAIGNARRTEMKELRQQISENRMSPVVALESRELSMTTEKFLRAIPKVGKIKAAQLARSADVPIDSYLGGRRASSRADEHRRALAAALRARGLGERS